MHSFFKGKFQVLEKNPAAGVATVLAVFKSRWGEVDGYLPVLFKLKAQHPDWTIMALLLGHDLVRRAADQPFLHSQLEAAADVLILAPASERPKTDRLRQPEGEAVARKASWFRSARKALKAWLAEARTRWQCRALVAYLKEKSIRVVLKDHGEDDWLLRQVHRLFRPVSVVMPHGTGLYIETGPGPIRKFRPAHADLVLVGHTPELPCFQRMLGAPDRRQFLVSGHPRYDAWWMERLAQDPAFQASEECRRAKHFERTFLFATRGPSDKALPLSVFQYLCRSVAEVVLDRPGQCLIVKPHPQQDLALLQSQFAHCDPGRFMISSFQTMQLAGLSHFVTCMVSGVILDALAAGKPTVEFFQYTRGSEFFSEDSAGKTVSSYTQLGLAVPAETKEQLQALIDDCFSHKNRSALWEDQRRRVAEFMRLDNQSATRAVQGIDALVAQSSS